MVYSQTKRTASVSSIVNRDTQGGSKKAGLPYLVGRESATSVAFRGTKQKLSVLQMTLYPNVRPSRPISMTPSAGLYFKPV